MMSLSCEQLDGAIESLTAATAAVRSLSALRADDTRESETSARHVEACLRMAFSETLTALRVLMMGVEDLYDTGGMLRGQVGGGCLPGRERRRVMSCGHVENLTNAQAGHKGKLVDRPCRTCRETQHQ